jgi:hypothetical protein
MNDDEIKRRKNLTFEQAEGLALLPTQLARTEVSPELRAVLWNYIHEEIQKTAEHSAGYGWSFLGKPWDNILKQVHVYREHKLIDDFNAALKPALAVVRRVFEQGSHSEIYGWLQFVLGINRSREFAQRITTILKYCRSPYRIVADDVICPIGTDEEAATIGKAFADLKASGLAGSREHLKSASAELSAGNFSDSIRESVHAVESIVRVLEPSGDFGKALAKLEPKAKIHGALVAGFKSIYGFSSDEQGIRHPLLDKGAPAVDEVDAMFMLGACSAFISYLINKSRAVGLLT